MLEGKECEGDSRDRIEGQLRASFTELQAQYCLSRNELAFRVAKALLQYVYDSMEPVEVLSFIEKHSEILNEQAGLIKECLIEDRKAQMH